MDGEYGEMMWNPRNVFINFLQKVLFPKSLLPFEKFIKRVEMSEDICSVANPLVTGDDLPPITNWLYSSSCA